MSKRRDPNTMDLFRDYETPDTMIARCDPEILRGGTGATLDVKISRAVAVAMDRSEKSREQIAEEMTAYLDGRRVSKDMLDAYASPGREDHRITLERFMALAKVTNPYPLLAFVCEAYGFVAVPQKYSKIVDAWHRKRVLDEQTRAYDRILAELGDLK